MVKAETRTKNTKRNIISGLLKQTVSIILPFIIRTIIIYVLGAEYQGLSGLFTSILQVLNLSDLGFSTAVTFILYKPIASGDDVAVKSILNFLRRVYYIVGSVIFVIGCVLLPFLPYLIAGDVPSNVNIYILFGIYLFNAVISYFLFAYKNTLFSAMQRVDVVNNVYTVLNIAIKLAQIIFLLTLKNYYVYTIIIPIGTIANNLLIQLLSKKYYSHLFPQGNISAETKAEVIKQVKAVFIGRVGDVARNSFDNIVLSTLLGLVVVAIYDNYYYIFSAIYGVLLVITNSMQASVGNSLVTESTDKNYQDFIKFTFIFMWIVGWCTVALLCLYQPFMLIWMRADKSMLLPFWDVLLICFYFYLINMNNTRNLYINGKGLFYECRIWFVMEALSNLVLNFVLGYVWGITGIILATIITIFIFNFIARNQVVFKNYFRMSPKQFYCQHLLYFLVTAIIAYGTYVVCSCINIVGILGLIIKAIIVIIFPNILYWLIYSKNKIFQASKQFVKSIIKQRR